MIKLSENKTTVLSAGDKRPYIIAMPLPMGLAGAAAKMGVSKNIEFGLLLEVGARAH